jgi:hypothetical protein
MGLQGTRLPVSSGFSGRNPGGYFDAVLQGLNAMSFSSLRKYLRTARPSRRPRRVWDPGGGAELLEPRLVLSTLAAVVRPAAVSALPPANTSLTLSSLNPGATQAITMTVSVSPATAGAPTPLGSVQILDFGKVIATLPLLNAQAVARFNLSLGSHRIAAKYLGDNSNGASTSSPFAVRVGTSNELYINNVYEKALHRAATPSELNNADMQFAAGVVRGTIVSGIVNSPEGKQASAQSIFLLYLGRQGTPAELASALRLAGPNGTRLSAAVLSSPEFIAEKSNGTPSSYVSALALAAIGQPFDPGTQAKLTAAVAHGASKFQIAQRVVLSPMGKNRQVTALYENILNRPPSTEELLAAFGRTGQPVNLAGLQASLLNSQEFYFISTAETQATTTSLVILPPRAATNSTVRLQATVVGANGNSPVPTGLVQFFNGSTSLGTALLDASGVATLSTTSLPAGSNKILAKYLGDINYQFSFSPRETSTIVTPATSTTALSATPTSAVFGQSVSLTATVTGTSGGAIPTGTVTFTTGTTTLGTAVLNSSGSATFKTTGLPVGTDPITAAYSGDTNYSASTSTASNVVVTAAATTTKVTGSPNPSKQGQSVTLSAKVTVTSPGAGTPSGTVQFFNGTTSLGSGTVTNGVATLNVTSLPIGANSITANYQGSANFSASTSPAFTQTVTGTAASATSLTAVPTSSIFGQSVTLTATVTHGTGGTGTPTGTVLFFSGTTQVGSQTLDSTGKATINVTTLPVGTDAITAQYQGDSTFATSTSPKQTVTVSKAATTTTLTATPNPLPHGQPLTLTAHVKTTGSSSATPTGTVEFFNGSTLLGKETLNSAGQAVFTTTDVPVGTLSLTAHYLGTASFDASVSAAVSVKVNPTAASKTTGSASPTTAAFGKQVTLSATVTHGTGGTGTPTGTVQFFNGSTLLGTGVLNSSGVATLNTSTLPVGTDSITAKYLGDTAFAPSTSTAFSVKITRATPVATASGTPNPSTSGQLVTLSATVTSSGSGTVGPSGTVEFFNGTLPLGTGVLNSSGVATLTVSNLPIGLNAINADYQGDANYNPVNAPTFTQQVTGTTASTTSLVASPNSTVFGQSVSLTATVIRTSGSGTPTGNVKFLNGTTVLGTATLNSSGTAVLNTTALPVGSNAVTAQYQGDATFASSTSTASSVTVAKASTSTAVTGSPNPATPGSAVTLKATVTATAPGSGHASGTVQFFNGGTSLGTGTLDASGVATFTTSSLPPGTNSITATYQGNTDFLTSTSPAYSQVVAGTAASVTTMTASPNPSVFGQSVQLQATVDHGSGGSGTPTGTVQFFNGSTSLGTATLTGGVATLNTTALPVGTDSITAHYQGDATFATSTTASPTTVTVNQSDTSTSLTGSPNPASAGTQVTLSAVVSATSPGSGIPTGTVTFLDNGTAIGTGTLNTAGTATFTTSTLSVGSHPLTAAYGGDTDYKTSTSSVFNEDIT